MTKLHCPTCGVHIDEHEAGGCLDLWAGEVVMGFGYNEESSGLSKRWFGRPDRYSERIGPAWMLVERLEFNHVQVDKTDDRSELWYCTVSCRPHVDRAWGDTAPLAITRAAIKVVR